MQKRIPEDLRNAQKKNKIQKAKIDKDDLVGLLKLFGNEAITNPFKLFAV